MKRDYKVYIDDILESMKHTRSQVTIGKNSERNRKRGKKLIRDNTTQFYCRKNLHEQVLSAS